MTNYLPHTSKKLHILQRREFAIFRLIQENAPHYKIVHAAEELRDARIRAIEASIASNGPRAGPTIHDKQIAMICDLPLDSTLAYFGCSVDPDSKQTMEQAS